MNGFMCHGLFAEKIKSKADAQLVRWLRTHLSLRIYFRYIYIYKYFGGLLKTITHAIVAHICVCQWTAYLKLSTSKIVYIIDVNRTFKSLVTRFFFRSTLKYISRVVQVNFGTRTIPLGDMVMTNERGRGASETVGEMT